MERTKRGFSVVCCILGPFGPTLEPFGVILEPFGALLEPFGEFGALLEPFGVNLGVFWPRSDTCGVGRDTFDVFGTKIPSWNRYI